MKNYLIETLRNLLIEMANEVIPSESSKEDKAKLVHSVQEIFSTMTELYVLEKEEVFTELNALIWDSELKDVFFEEF